MIASIAGWAARSALMSSPLGGFLKAVPRWVWIVLAVLALLLVAVLWHGAKVEHLRTISFNAGYAKRVGEEQSAAARRAGRDAAITAPIRSKTDETIRNNARRADTLRVRGPGAAACLDPAAPAPGGRQPGSGQADAAVDRVPGEERPALIALPFAPTIDAAERCDANLAELLAWREQRAALEADRARP